MEEKVLLQVKRNEEGNCELITNMDNIDDEFDVCTTLVRATPVNSSVRNVLGAILSASIDTMKRIHDEIENSSVRIESTNIKS